MLIIIDDTLIRCPVYGTDKFFLSGVADGGGKSWGKRSVKAGGGWRCRWRQ
ncbi:MAG: hypothetical protein GX765_04805 [Candidatus Moranbacteria bacterium]|nr:hypothetical protein [Candidatus Moranbacteria bacterium]